VRLTSRWPSPQRDRADRLPCTARLGNGDPRPRDRAVQDALLQPGGCPGPSTGRGPGSSGSPWRKARRAGRGAAAPSTHDQHIIRAASKVHQHPARRAPRYVRLHHGVAGNLTPPRSARPGDAGRRGPGMPGAKGPNAAGADPVLSGPLGPRPCSPTDLRPWATGANHTRLRSAGQERTGAMGVILPPPLSVPWELKPISSAMVGSETLPGGRKRYWVKHRVLKGVTPPMLVWWFGHLEGDVEIEGRLLNRYRVWHRPPPRSCQPQLTAPTRRAENPGRPRAGRVLEGTFGPGCRGATGDQDENCSAHSWRAAADGWAGARTGYACSAVAHSSRNPTSRRYTMATSPCGLCLIR